MGCQMNVVDTEKMESILCSMGFNKANTPASADIILANTCAIREKAQQKAFSFMGRLTRLKENNPDLIVGIGGCVAQQEGAKILDRLPQVNFVFGTDAVCRLPELIRAVQTEKKRITDIQTSRRVHEFDQNEISAADQASVTRFVTIMQGCDNFCTYCVVPYVRGREKSRDPENILKEVRELVFHGAREVTLLGQNVNSYGKKEGLCAFVELLEKINEIEDLMRIRFTTSHPKDLSSSLIQAFSRLDKLCRHIHLPVQSGSSAVLKRMNRGYSQSQYLEKIEALKKTGDDIAITTDIIVGFPGETETDFNCTLDLIKQVEYDSLFVFNYSDRPNAPAVAFSDKIPHHVQKERLQEVLKLQEEITFRKHLNLVGRISEVLVEGKSKKQHRNDEIPDLSDFQWSGRTSTNKIVNFISDHPTKMEDESLYGKIACVEIQKALAHSLWGRMVETASKPKEIKGEKHYAA